MSQTERRKDDKRYYEAEAGLNHALAVFGDHIAKREGYKENDGLEAVIFYLVTHHHWPPAQVRGMALQDIRFILSEEMAGWTLAEVSRQ